LDDNSVQLRHSGEKQDHHYHQPSHDSTVNDCNTARPKLLPLIAKEKEELEAIEEE
jgi:hypothetical protein